MGGPFRMGANPLGAIPRMLAYRDDGESRSMSITRIFIAAGAALMLQGCLARTAIDMATLPVRAAGKAVDLATTSQSESDEKRGRALRKREEQLGRLERSYARNLERCEDGDAEACEAARADYAAIQRLLPTLPREPED